MNRIAVATVIRGSGECQAYINGVVMQEMKRLNERHAAEMKASTEKLECVRRSRDRMREAKLREMRNGQSRKPRIGERIRKALVTAYAVGFALLLEWHFIEEIRENET